MRGRGTSVLVCGLMVAVTVPAAADPVDPLPVPHSRGGSWLDPQGERPDSMPYVEPRRPGPVRMPLLRPAPVDPVPMPEAGPGVGDLTSLPDLLVRRRGQ